MEFPVESDPGHSLPANSVFLGTGPDRGAAIVFTGEALEGSDLEIRRAGGPWAGIRAGVERRDLKEAVCFAAVFPGLAAGDYQVRITELTWPGL
jgi:hypothetical protein